MKMGDVIKLDDKLYVVVEVNSATMRIMGLDGGIKTVSKDICDKEK